MKRSHKHPLARMPPVTPSTRDCPEISFFLFLPVARLRLVQVGKRALEHPRKSIFLVVGWDDDAEQLVRGIRRAWEGFSPDALATCTSRESSREASMQLVGGSAGISRQTKRNLARRTGSPGVQQSALRSKGHATFTTFSILDTCGGQAGGKMVACPRHAQHAPITLSSLATAVVSYSIGL